MESVMLPMSSLWRSQPAVFDAGRTVTGAPHKKSGKIQPEGHMRPGAYAHTEPRRFSDLTQRYYVEPTEEIDPTVLEEGSGKEAQWGTRAHHSTLMMMILSYHCLPFRVLLADSAETARLMALAALAVAVVGAKVALSESNSADETRACNEGSMAAIEQLAVLLYDSSNSRMHGEIT